MQGEIKGDSSNLRKEEVEGRWLAIRKSQVLAAKPTDRKV